MPSRRAKAQTRLFGPAFHLTCQAACIEPNNGKGALLEAALLEVRVGSDQASDSRGPWGGATEPGG